MSTPGDDAREWHRDVVETAPVPVAVYGSDRLLRYVNEAAVEFVNAEDRETLVGRSAAEFVHADDRDEVARRIERVLEDREAVPPEEFRFVDTTGREKYALTSGAPVTYEGEPAGQAVLNDVTEQRRRERELRRERDRFALLFDSLPSAVVHGIAKDGGPIVQRVNERFEEVFGYSREEIVGENLDEHIVPEDERADAERLNRRILEEGRVQTEVERETADGPREFLLHIVMRDLDEDEPEGYAIYTDITERKRTERELERQNEQLDEFVSVVSHDLRNPLNVALGRIELAGAECDSDHLDGAEHALERMETLIEDLLTFARQGEDALDIEPVGLADLCGNCWETVETEAATLVAETSATVRADRSRLQQLFENLFRNSVEHSGDGVTITVGDLPGGFYVADDGPGIPEEKRERVFEGGYSTSEEGTGFGLAIVRRIAEVHGWEVDVTESEGGGARFEFTGVETV